MSEDQQKQVDEIVNEPVAEATTPNTATPTEKTSGEAASHKGPKGKKRKIMVDEAQLQEAAEKYQALSDAHLRLRAEFDNFKKRKEEEGREQRAQGVADAVKLFLPVMDNMDRALQSASDAASEGIAAGIKLCIESFFAAFARYELALIPSEGVPFDPMVHDAVMQQPTEDEALKGTIAATLQKGYTLSGKVIRHSMVSVYA